MAEKRLKCQVYVRLHLQVDLVLFLQHSSNSYSPILCCEQWSHTWHDAVLEFRPFSAASGWELVSCNSRACMSVCEMLYGSTPCGLSRESLRVWNLKPLQHKMNHLFKSAEQHVLVKLPYIFTWTVERRGVVNLKAGEQSICRNPTHFPKHSRVFEKRGWKPLSQRKAFKCLLQGRLSSPDLSFEAWEKIPVTMRSSPKFYLAQVLHFQFQAAVIKLPLPNLLCPRYIRKYKRLPSPKGSCDLAIPGCDLKLPLLLITDLLYSLAFCDRNKPQLWWKVSMSFVGRTVGIDLGSWL